MNDLHHPCELWAERISLAAAGCLPADEERELRRHLETCSACRERFEQLTRLCGMLAASRLPAAGTAPAIVERAMSVVASSCERAPQNRHSERSEESGEESYSDEILRSAQNDSVGQNAGVSQNDSVGQNDGVGQNVSVCTQAEMIRPAFLARSRTAWRWIMRSPVSRVTAAAILVLAIGGVALWFHAGGAVPAFADFLKPILEARTVKYKCTTERAGKIEAVAEWSIVIASNRSHGEIKRDKTYSPLDCSVNIHDGSSGTTLKTLTYWPAAKLAVVGTIVGMPKGHNWFQEFALAAVRCPQQAGCQNRTTGPKGDRGTPIRGIPCHTPLDLTRHGAQHLG